MNYLESILVHQVKTLLGMMRMASKHNSVAASVQTLIANPQPKRITWCGGVSMNETNHKLTHILCVRACSVDTSNFCCVRARALLQGTESLFPMTLD